MASWGILNLVANDHYLIERRNVSSIETIVTNPYDNMTKSIFINKIMDIVINIAFITEYSDIKLLRIKQSGYMKNLENISNININFNKRKIGNNLYLFYTNFINQYMNIVHYDNRFELFFDKPIIKYYIIGGYLDNNFRNRLVLDNTIFHTQKKLEFSNEKMEVHNITLNLKNNIQIINLIKNGYNKFQLQPILLKIKLINVNFINNIELIFNGIRKFSDKEYLKYIDKIIYNKNSLGNQNINHSISAIPIKIYNTNLTCVPNGIRNIIIKYIPNEDSNYSISFTNGYFGAFCQPRCDFLQMIIHYDKMSNESEIESRDVEINRSIEFTTCQRIGKKNNYL